MDERQEERVFRTVKELQGFYAPMLVSLEHVRSLCADVIDYYNRIRRTGDCLPPDGRDCGKPWQPVLRREAFFEGQLLAYRFA